MMLIAAQAPVMMKHIIASCFESALPIAYR